MSAVCVCTRVRVCKYKSMHACLLYRTYENESAFILPVVTHPVVDVFTYFRTLTRTLLFENKRNDKMADLACVTTKTVFRFV